jgi:hypothetical protein
LAIFNATVRVRRAFATPLLAIICIPFVLAHAHDAKAYRPFDGTDGDVADLGEFELELGPLDYAQQGSEKAFYTPTVLNLGVLPRMELVADFVLARPFEPEDSEAYQVVDTDVFAKVLLRKGVIQDETGPSIALEAGPLLPEVNGDDGFGASANLIVSERLKSLLLHLNNEAELTRGDLEFEWTTSLIGELDLGAAVRPVAEIEWARDSAGANTYSALLGGIWNAADGLDFDAAGLIASVDGQQAFEVRFGLTWAVSVWTPKEAKLTATMAPKARGEAQ